MNAIFAAEAAIRDGLPSIIQRHRAAGHLTWNLLHLIESEILAELATSGRHAPTVLGLLRSSKLMNYRRDDSIVSLEGQDIVPVAFAAIVDAWGKVH